MKLSLRVFVFIVFIIIVSACTPLRKATNSKQNLELRITEVMDAKVAGNWDQVYHYFYKDYQKQMTHSNFINRSRIKFDSYTIETITVNTDQRSAEAQLIIDFSSKGFNFTGVKDMQYWVYEHNNWYQKIPIQAHKGMMFGN